MKTLRTPDERFEGLDGYPFEPHYADIAVSSNTVQWTLGLVLVKLIP